MHDGGKLPGQKFSLSFENFDPLLQFVNEIVQFHGPGQREIKVGGELRFHALENGILRSGLSATGKTLRSRAAERSVGRIGDVLDADAERGHQLFNETQRVLRYGGVRYRSSVLEGDGVAFG